MSKLKVKSKQLFDMADYEISFSRADGQPWAEKIKVNEATQEFSGPPDALEDLKSVMDIMRPGWSQNVGATVVLKSEATVGTAKVVAALVNAGHEDLADEILETTVAGPQEDRIVDIFYDVDLDLNIWEHRFKNSLDTEKLKALKGVREWLEDSPRNASPKLTRDSMQGLLIMLDKQSPEYKALNQIYDKLWKI